MKTRKIITAGDVRDQKSRDEARQIARARAYRRAYLEDRLASMDALYTQFRGAVHRMARMRVGRQLRELGPK